MWMDKKAKAAGERDANGVEVEDVRDHYRWVLGLGEPWEVERVRQESGGVVVSLGHARGSQFQCPECGKLCKLHDHDTLRRWRHRDMGDQPCHVETRPPRMNCLEHGVRVASLPWSDARSRYTHSFEELVLGTVRAGASIESAGKLFCVAWNGVQGMVNRAVERGLARRSASEPVAEVGLDEKSFLKGQSYVTVLSDQRGGRILEVTRGRGYKPAKEAILSGLSPQQQVGVRASSIDMCEGFRLAIQECLPQAKIVYDRFHVMLLANKCIDTVRRQEHAENSKAGDSSLKGSRWFFLRYRENMRPDQIAHLESLCWTPLKTARTWQRREMLSILWLCNSLEEGKTALEAWYQSAIRSRIEPLKTLARTIKKHSEGILNYFLFPITNAIAEGFNSSIQAIKSAARGFRNFHNYRARILFFHGKLELALRPHFHT